MHPQTTTINCPVQPVEFSKIGKRKSVTEFDGGHMASNVEALALREVEERCQILDRASVVAMKYGWGISIGCAARIQKHEQVTSNLPTAPIQ